MMKKNLLWTLAAALTLVGCSQDELLNDGGLQEGGDAIAFSSYLGSSAQGRATEVTTETLEQEGFGVNAWYTMGDDFAAATEKEAFMTNTKVTYNKDKSAWTYSPLKYWPNNKDHKVSFFAYGPYDLPASSEITADKTAIDFTVENDVKSQVDLIYNTNYSTIDMKKPAVNTRINFTFDHALSRISFSVEAAVDVVESNKDDSKKLDGNTVINVKRVALVSADAEDGEYEYTEGDEGPFYTEGTLSLLKPANDGDSPWTIETPDNTQGFVLDGDNFYRTVTDAAGSEVVQLHKFNQKQPLTNEESYLMVIPQDLLTSADGGTSNGFKIYIEYDVITEGEDGDSSTITNHIVSKDAMSVDFKQGMAYNFNLVLGMTSVQFGASVTDWDDATEYEEWLPENTASVTFAYDKEQERIQIKNAADLIKMRDLVNSGAMFYVNEAGDGVVTVESKALSRSGEAEEKAYAEADYLQVGDIDLSGIEWTPIGYRVYGASETTQDNPFKGSYRVAYNEDKESNYQISNLTINHTDNDRDLGLFGYVSGEVDNHAELQGIRLVNPNIIGHSTIDIDTNYSIGGIVGFGQCVTIDDCHIDDDGDEYRIISGYYAGGIIGYINSDVTITNSTNHSVQIEGRIVGGICGQATGGTVTSCYNYGFIQGFEEQDSHAGGIIGQVVGKGSIENCANYAGIKSTWTSGGIIGTGDVVTITASWNEGDLTGYSDENSCIGGIAGWLSSASTTITACYNIAGSFNTANSAGGLVGLSSCDAVFTACYSTTTSISSATNTGALVGFNSFSGGTGTPQYTACYYAEGLNAYGYTSEEDVTGVIPVDDTNTLWGDAMNAMNAELTGWAYSFNDDEVLIIGRK